MWWLFGEQEELISLTQTHTGLHRVCVGCMKALWDGPLHQLCSDTQEHRGPGDYTHTQLRSHMHHHLGMRNKQTNKLMDMHTNTTLIQHTTRETEDGKLQMIINLTHFLLRRVKKNTTSPEIKWCFKRQITLKEKTRNQPPLFVSIVYET